MTASDFPPAPSLRDSAVHGLWLLLGLYVVTLLAAAVFTPPIYLAFHAWAEDATAPLLVYLGEKDFPRYFDRVRWLFVMLGLPWLCRRTGLTRARVLGLRTPAGTWVRTGLWFGVGTVMVAGIAAGQVLSGAGELRPPDGAGALVAGIGLAILSAAIIGFIEELVFRGIVFQLVLATLRLLPAAVVAALFFAILHFQRVPGHLWPENAEVGLGTGFQVAWWTVAAMATSVEAAKLGALVLAGLALCLVFHRSGSLYPAMGLHAGWVWVAQMHRRWISVDEDAAPEAALALWGTRDMIDGALPLLALVLLAAALVVTTRRRTAPA
ncbi:MAG: CPBP family intramembrane metalloprotease [Acidobacteriota bacterium]|jgi:membrane protease YdiL (CAAX protease family)